MKIILGQHFLTQGTEFLGMKIDFFKNLISRLNFIKCVLILISCQIHIYVDSNCNLL
jgi:hypothetical protein